MTHILNTSLETKTFPKLWKQALIRPLPKVKTPSSANDFRPICILPTLSKVLERVVHKQLTDYITTYQLLDEYQSGFRTGHNTTTALLKVTEDIREAIDQSKLTIMTLLDFSKAFDTVDLDILMFKLRTLNLSDAVLKWFNSYLYDRQQSISHGNRVSPWRIVKAGVPQGSVLGPLLFMIYINDVTRSINFCSYHLYADDLQLYIHTKKDELNEAVQKLNNDLTTVFSWTKINGLKLNTDKSQAIVVGHERLLSTLQLETLPNVIINEEIIEYSSSVKNLGVTLDKNVNWNQQVTQISKKVFSILHSLKSLNNFLTRELKTKLINTLVMPHFDYCDSLLTDLTEHLNQRLQRAHNACIRFVCNTRRFDHVTPSFNMLSWLRLKERRQLHSLSLLFKILNSSTPRYLSSRFQRLSVARANDLGLLRIPQHRTSAYSSSFSVALPRVWNSLPREIRDCRTYSMFHSKVRKMLLDR